jgi:hypothetical protein
LNITLILFLQALRGAGESFGIVTEFIFETQPEPAHTIEYRYQFKYGISLFFFIETALPHPTRRQGLIICGGWEKNSRSGRNSSRNPTSTAD